MKGVRIIRGLIKDAVREDGKVTRCSVVGLNDEQIDDVEVFNGTEFWEVPADDCECIAIQWGHRTIVIALADRRIATEIELRSSGPVTIFADTINLGGSTGLQALIDARFEAVYNEHTHVAPSGGGTTDAPLIKLGDMLPNVSVSTTVVKGK